MLRVGDLCRVSTKYSFENMIQWRLLKKKIHPAQIDSKHGTDAYPEKSLLDQHYLDDSLQLSSVLILRAEKVKRGE